VRDPYRLPDLPLPVSWHAHAACYGHDDPDLWHQDTAGPLGQRRTAAAKRVCRTCPTQMRCLEAHLNEPYGVWGGLDPRERREQRRQPTVARPQCGTDNGYQWHQRKNEVQCDPCMLAHAARTRQTRERRSG
jgi:WhiB family redox-sensing transcriptional regulator